MIEKWIKLLKRTKATEMPWGNTMYADCPFCKGKGKVLISSDKGNGHLLCKCFKCGRMLIQ